MLKQDYRKFDVLLIKKTQGVKNESRNLRKSVK